VRRNINNDCRNRPPFVRPLARPSLLMGAALVFVSFGSAPSKPHREGLPIARGEVQLTSSNHPVIPDPSLPLKCRPQPGKHASNQVNNSNEIRQTGGTIDVVATFRRGTSPGTAVGDFLAFDSLDGNCFYSEDVKFEEGRFLDMFGFEKRNPNMNASAVAHFLRLQSYAYSSVVLRH
jgi:hypothetical protein